MYKIVSYKGEKNMKVFISWSGETSFAVAKVLKEWIPCIIQDVEPYFSSEDIDKGARWSTDIAKELEEASFGILCVTKDNLQSQWLNFEAGALSKAIDKSRVCPLLFRVKTTDITNSPILQFQMAVAEKNDVFKLFKSINASLGETGLDEARLEKVFDAFWPQMEEAFDCIQDSDDGDEKKRGEKDTNAVILEEMLNLLRSQQMMLRSPEKILPVDYVENVLQRLSRDRDKMMRNSVPPRVFTEIQRTEIELNRVLGEMIEENEESYDKIRNYVREYIMAVNRLLKFIDYGYSRYELYRSED